MANGRLPALHNRGVKLTNSSSVECGPCCQRVSTLQAPNCCARSSPPGTTTRSELVATSRCRAACRPEESPFASFGLCSLSASTATSLQPWTQRSSHRCPLRPLHNPCLLDLVTLGQANGLGWFRFHRWPVVPVNRARRRQAFSILLFSRRSCRPHTHTLSE